MKNLVIFLLCCSVIAPAHAGSDAELTHSLRCVKLFHKNERIYNIPGDALYSISLRESGRKHSTKDVTMPWPWTANVEGKGYHFDSKSEAVYFVKQQLMQGKESIDVGCMQVNLKYHPHAFNSVEEAFDPKANIAYSASFLRSKYEQLGSWHKAIAHYHSATPELGNPYKESVIKIARNIDKYKKAFKKHPRYPDDRRIAEVYSSPPRRQSQDFVAKSRRYKSDMMVHVPVRQVPRT